jgi:tungstate transport system ATP-binding protein
VTDTSVFRMQDLQKDYGDRRVLSIDALEVLRGEILGIVGPSGAGKSTLLRLLNFLEQPTAGRIEFGGEKFGSGDVMPLELRRRVTTVFQRPMLLNRNVWDNVAFGLSLRGLRDSQKVVQATLEQVGMEKLARQQARLLSGGEAQRVALARALVLHPEVLLLDEPTANLDPYNVGLIEDIVRQANQNGGTTIVIVTHNVFQAHRLAKRVAFILGGKLVEVAETQQFFEAPADNRTRLFVNGEMVY